MGLPQQNLIHFLRTDSMNCRLLYLVGQLGAGGSERQLYYLLNTIDRKRFRPELVVWSFRNDDTYVRKVRKLGIPLHSFPNTLNATRKLLAFRHLVMRIRPEVLHSYSFYTNVAAWWATRGTSTIAIGSSRGDFVSEKKESGLLLGRLSARWPRDQICNNFMAATAARRAHTLFAPSRVAVVRNGIDLQNFRMLPLLMDHVRILGVGSLLQYKRWDRLLKVAVSLKQRSLDFVVEIAGGGPLRESLEKQAQDLGLLDRVRFTGHTDNVSASLAGSTFLAHTSDTEGCPNVVMEAMACGRAVVATDPGDIPSLIDNGKTGFVVRCGDDEALADRMAELITDRELCRCMGRAGRAKAEREFGLDRLVSETLAAYQAVGWRDS
jgi:glycosyltransferase involved in cell wall biosynthesis